MMRAVVCAVVLAFAPQASAFVCTRTPALGPSVFWPRRVVEVRPAGGGFETTPAELVAVLERGAATWTGAGCSDLEIIVGDPTVERIVGFNWHAGSGSLLNENIIIFRNDTPGDEVDRWLHTLGAIAITTVTFDAHTGRLLDADVEFNDVAFTFTTCDPEDAGCDVQFDLENTLTHELGHVIGLDHPPSDEPGAFEATMFASASAGDTGKRTLADDDIEGTCTIYPSDDDVAGECYGVGRPAPLTLRFEQTACGASGQGAMGVLALVLILRRRRTSAYTVSAG